MKSALALVVLCALASCLAAQAVTLFAGSGCAAQNQVLQSTTGTCFTVPAVGNCEIDVCSRWVFCVGRCVELAIRSHGVHPPVMS